MEISRQAATRLEMWASDGGCGHEATVVHDAAWRRGGDVGHSARGISHEQDTARHGRTRRGEIQRRGLLGRVSQYRPQADIGLRGFPPDLSP